jgi:hypothetical protein
MKALPVLIFLLGSVIGYSQVSTNKKSNTIPIKISFFSSFGRQGYQESILINEIEFKIADKYGPVKNFGVDFQSYKNICKKCQINYGFGINVINQHLNYYIVTPFLANYFDSASENNLGFYFTVPVSFNIIKHLNNKITLLPEFEYKAQILISAKSTTSNYNTVFYSFYSHGSNFRRFSNKLSLSLLLEYKIRDRKYINGGLIIENNPQIYKDKFSSYFFKPLILGTKIGFRFE